MQDNAKKMNTDGVMIPECNYTVIQKETASELEEEVRAMFRDGYKFHGPMMIYNDLFIQVMYRAEMRVEPLKVPKIKVAKK